jgi:ParB-like chromosome segregation protein Spo0J
VSVERAPSGWRNRIIRSGSADVSAITANPKNWRQHPQFQADALAGVLAEVGYVQSVIINERSGHLVDGHLRVALAEQHAEPSVPAVWVDLDEAEETLILATLDPLSALAETNADALAALLAETSTDDDALAGLLANLARDAGITPPDFEPVGIDEQGRLDEKAKVVCPECGHAFSPA